MRDLDGIDHRLAAALQEDGRLTNAELGKRVGLAPSSVYERVKRLEEAGHIRGYHARLDPGSFGLGVTAYVFVDAGEIGSEGSVAEGLTRVPGVREVHHIAGEDCFLVKLWTRDTEALGKLLRADFGAAGARSTRTTIVLETVLDRQGIPLEAGEAALAAVDMEPRNVG